MGNTAAASERIDVKRLTNAYRAAHFGRRVCQLFSLIPLFVFAIGIFNFSFDVLGWSGRSLSYLSGQALQPEMFTLEAFSPVFDLYTVAGLVISFAIFAAFSNMDRAKWLLPIGLIALAANFYFEFHSAFEENFDWASVSNPDMLIAQSIAPYLYLPPFFALHLYFAWIISKAALTPLQLSSSQRAMLSEFDGNRISLFGAFKNLVNIPEANRYAKHPAWTGLLMIFAGLANFMNFWRTIIVVVFIALAPVLAVDLFPKVGVVIRALADGRNLNQVAIDLTVVTGFLAFYLAIILVIPFVIGVLAKSSVRRAEAQMRTSLETIQHLDERAPILFLRSFLNDTVPLPKGNFTLARWLLDDAGSMDSLDMMILAEGTRVGPTVALGNPDDPAPPYGVARGYFEHDSWKEAVIGLCERSAAIVLVLDETEGVEWEIGHIAAKRYTHKTLFLLAPEDVGTVRGHALLGRALARASWTDPATQVAQIAQDDDGPVFGFILRAGKAELLTSRELHKYDYLVAMRIFLRTLPSADTQERGLPDIKNLSDNSPSGASDGTRTRDLRRDRPTL